MSGISLLFSRSSSSYGGGCGSNCSNSGGGKNTDVLFQLAALGVLAFFLNEAVVMMRRRRKRELQDIHQQGSIAVLIGTHMMKIILTTGLTKQYTMPMPNAIT